VRQKVDSVLSGIGKDPRLLSKFIKQLLNCDETIRDTFDYNGGNLEFGWKGLTWDVLEKWFDRWIDGERDFALQSMYIRPLYLIQRQSRCEMPDFSKLSIGLVLGLPNELPFRCLL
jgi:hypothetical protein